MIDPLSDPLALLKPRSHISAGFDAAGDWSLRFDRMRGVIRCYAVVRGACWLGVAGDAAPLQLHGGDSFVLPNGSAFTLASNTGPASADAREILGDACAGNVVVRNGGGEFLLVGSRFAVQGHHADLLLGMLPPIVHLRRGTEQAALRWTIERMMQELREPQPGGALIAQHLAHMMLIQALRLHLSDARGHAGWLAALADRQIGAVIGAMHADPARRWTLQELAQAAAMSRSVLALRFRQLVGMPPMEYLTRWRMLLAADRLENSDDSNATIALSLGYESESAFSAAFKKIMGSPPRRYVSNSAPAGIMPPPPASSAPRAGAAAAAGMAAPEDGLPEARLRRVRHRSSGPAG